MRPSFRFALLAALSRRSVREIERPDRITVVRAPEDWTDVQVEAWLDWAEAADLPLDGRLRGFYDRCVVASLPARPE